MKRGRRALLVTGGGALILLGGAGSWLATRTATSARVPWERAGDSFGDARLDALAFAILAPNPHNMQPWRVSLDGDSALTLYADPNRLLPATDPHSRQITIGFGAFLELLRQAAAEKGTGLAVQAFPEGEAYADPDRCPIAHVRFLTESTAGRDPLFGEVLRRSTRRESFDMTRPVDPAALTRIANAADPVSGVDVAVTQETQQVTTLRELSAEAWKSEWQDPDARAETIRVTRIGPSEVEANPWGITLDGPLLSTLGAAGVLTRDAMDSPGSAAYEQGLSSYLDACRSAMAFVWSTTPKNSRVAQLNAGAAWVRVHQAATREGLAFHPLSQALQEFPAMARHYAQVHELLAADGHTVQMLARLGHSSVGRRAPREPLRSKLVTL